MQIVLLFSASIIFSGCTTVSVSDDSSSVRTAAPAASVSAPASPVYKVGQVGPAGGLIFYVKANNSGGWRYMEAAPEDVYGKFPLAREGINTSDLLERTIGQGLRNTKEYMKQAESKGGGFGWAAQVCDEYEVNGYDDWFLPSLDELNQVYGNLHQKSLGGFFNDWYWSSTVKQGYDSNGWFVGSGQNFADGSQNPYDNANRIEYRVRPIRQFADDGKPHAAQPTSTAAASGLYKVGDTGPAGGIIFYIKDNDMDNWRYLECAPADIEGKFPLSREGIRTINLLERTIGWGLRNTNEYMRQAKTKGGGFGWAAQVCDEYELNGFDDWFLPCMDELNQMYGVLHRRGLGDFFNAWYWSSTVRQGYDSNGWFAGRGQNFENGSQDPYDNSNRIEYRVRPIRQF